MPEGVKGCAKDKANQTNRKQALSQTTWSSNSGRLVEVQSKPIFRCRTNWANKSTMYNALAKLYEINKDESLSKNKFQY
jgi:hypothetical protein